MPRTFYGRLGEMFAGEIGGERSLSSSTIINAVSRAFLMFSVADNPGCAMGDVAFSVSSFPTEPETGAFRSSRHSSLILSMLASVVKSLPATRSMTRRPLLASRRNPVTVIVPSGKAIAAAMLNRRGASGSMSSRCGILRITELAVELISQPYRLAAAVGPAKFERVLSGKGSGVAEQHEPGALAAGDVLDCREHVVHPRR